MTKEELYEQNLKEIEKYFSLNRSFSEDESKKFEELIEWIDRYEIECLGKKDI